MSAKVENPLKTNQFEGASEKSIGQNSISIQMGNLNINNENKNENNIENDSNKGPSLGFQPVSKYTRQLMEQ